MNNATPPEISIETRFKASARGRGAFTEVLGWELELDPEILKIRVGLGLIWTPKDRYVSGSLQDLLRDPETEDDRLLWAESNRYMAKIPRYRGREQAFILYYRSD